MVVLFFFFFLSRTASTINIDGRCMGLHEFPTLYVANIFSTDITPPLLLSASSLLCHTRCVHYTRAGHRWCARRPRLCFLGLSILFLFHQRRSVALGWNVRRLERIGARAWSGVDGVLFSISSYCNFLGFFFFFYFTSYDFVVTANIRAFERIAIRVLTMSFFTDIFDSSQFFRFFFILFLFHQRRCRVHCEYSHDRTNWYSGVDTMSFFFFNISDELQFFRF